MEIIMNSDFLRSELNNFTAQIKAIKAEKERNITWLEHYQTMIDGLNAEIIRRNESPELYPLSAGAGTIDDVKRELASFKTEMARLETEIAEFDQPLEDIEESRHQTLFTLADKIGLETLKKERTAIGKEMAKHNRLQHEAYETQKERYENCKKTFGFTPDDRSFIAYHKSLNEAHMDAWTKLCDKRHELCELIDALDPNDEDLGFDEEEDV